RNDRNGLVPEVETETRRPDETIRTTPTKTASPGRIRLRRRVARARLRRLPPSPTSRSGHRRGPGAPRPPLVKRVRSWRSPIMANKMLIDAAHPEETRVVVLRGNRVEEFDFESASRKQLRGNIYLAKVTRVEPSLQAAFVDYGGNRHGFLAFSEIHP